MTRTMMMSNTTIPVAARSILLYGLAAIGIISIASFPVQIISGALQGITACKPIFSEDGGKMMASSSRGGGGGGNHYDYVQEKRKQDEDVTMMVTAPATVQHQHIHATKSTTLDDEEEDKIMTQQQQHPPPPQQNGGKIVDLLAGLALLTTDNFTAEVTFRQHIMKLLDGVPNLQDFQECRQSNMVPWRGGTVAADNVPAVYRIDARRPFS
jgi:hypothetical protein